MKRVSFEAKAERGRVILIVYENAGEGYRLDMSYSRAWELAAELNMYGDLASRQHHGMKDRPNT